MLAIETRQDRPSQEVHPIYSEGGNGGIWRVLAVNASTVISASYDHHAKMWSLDHDSGQLEFREVKILSKQRREVLSIASVSENIFATGSSDGKMCFWNMGGTLLNSLRERTIHGFYSMATVDENIIATGACQRPRKYRGNWDHIIKIWDCTKGICIAELAGHSGGVSGIVKINEHLLASSSGDGTVRIWDRISGTACSIFQNHTDYVYSLAKASEGYLVSASKDRTIRLWDIEQEKETGQFIHKDGIAHDSTVYDVKVSNNTVASCSRDGSVKVWDSRTLKLVQMLDPEDGFVYGVDILPGGQIVVGTAGKPGSPEKNNKHFQHKNNAHVVVWDLRSQLE
jgi:WD40 repeat protein